MPKIACPGCRRSISLQPEEFDLLIECASCGQWFHADADEARSTPRGSYLAVILIAAVFLAAIALGALALWHRGAEQAVDAKAKDEKTSKLAETPAKKVETETLPTPVLSSRQMLESSAQMDRYKDKRVIVIGKIKGMGTTELNARLFWDVPEGLAYVGLTTNLEKDQAEVKCVFHGGRPGLLRIGVECQIEGIYRGLIPTAGVPLVVECELKRMEEEDDEVRIPARQPPEKKATEPIPTLPKPEPPLKPTDKPPEKPVAREDSDLDKALIRNLLAQLEKRSAQDRIAGLNSLRELGTKARAPAGQRVVELLFKDPVPLVRQKAREAIDKIDPEIADHVTTLVADPNLGNRLQAIDGLRALGKKGRNAAPLLAFVALGKDREGAPALSTLITVAPDMDLENVLIGASKRNDATLRSTAIDGFIRLENIKNLDVVIGVIVQHLRADSDSSVRRQAAVTLGQLGEKAQKAEPALRLATSDSDKAVREAAKHSLMKIGK